MPTCQLCRGDFPNSKVIGGKVRALHRRKFCLTCSPFGKTNRKGVKRLKAEAAGRKKCVGCGKNKRLDQFYTVKFSNCIPCESERRRLKNVQFKRMAIDYKGGCCIVCGYQRCLSAMVFHHRNPAEKEFQVSGFQRRTVLSDEVKIELDKCDLLCKNCHSESHCQREVVSESSVVEVGNCFCAAIA